MKRKLNARVRQEHVHPVDHNRKWISKRIRVEFGGAFPAPHVLGCLEEITLSALQQKLPDRFRFLEGTCREIL